MPHRFRLPLRAPKEGQDSFFLWSMVILPIVADGSYIFDAYYYLFHDAHIHRYQGLISTILVVFTYLRYCVPIASHRILASYYILLCLLTETGTIGYLIVYCKKQNYIDIMIYSGWAVLELITTCFLIYYRVYRHCQPNFHVESKHLFHFISRLEIILAIFIPFFISNTSPVLTKHSIAFFLLFEFFSDSYCRFQGFWIKSNLYIFVCAVTVCVATEWIYANEHKEIYEILSSVFELISAVLCNTLIILQFSPYHFKPLSLSKIARKRRRIQQTNDKETRIEMGSDTEPEDEKLNRDTH
ncbi:unnamed protein product [Adineta steineri]|uniref:Uncharacterized protein n=1 Tax=Adineta steineri TaxID=433720 RepID=A0A819CP72_9BILA|nr:unnamed protein product [Adineta steineri]CAF3821225.1 unnamed protein product [Adineta steineri]